MFLRVRTSVSGFALPGLRKENLELLSLTVWIEYGQPSGEHRSPDGAIFWWFRRVREAVLVTTQTTANASTTTIARQTSPSKRTAERTMRAGVAFDTR